MKTIHKLLALLLVSCSLTFVAFAHNHEKREAGPNGGRLLAKAGVNAEFLVTAERKIQITFLDAAGKPLAPVAQVVTVTAGSRTSPTVLNFKRVGNALLSDGKLPEGNRVSAVVQIKDNATARPKTERITVDLAVCPDCKLQEYACTCEHDH